MVTVADISSALDAHGIQHGKIRWKANFHNIAFSDDELVFCKVLRPSLDSRLSLLELSLAMEYGPVLMAQPIHPELIRVGETTMSVWRWEPMETFTAALISPDEAASAASALNRIHRLARPQSQINNMHDLDLFSYNIKTRTELAEARHVSPVHLDSLRELSRRFVEKKELRFSHLVFAHGDTHVGNAVRRGSSKDVTWIDFESAKMAPREMDIATLYVNLSIVGGNDAAWNEAKNTFMQEVEIDEGIVRLFTIARMISMSSYVLLHPDEDDIFIARIEALEPLLYGGEPPRRLPPTRH